MSTLTIPAPKVQDASGYMGGSRFVGGNVTGEYVRAKDVAAKTRAFVKALAKAGEVPADVKVRVTSESFSGGQSVNAVLSSTNATSDWDSGPLWVDNPAYDPSNPFDPRYPERLLRPEVKALADKVRAFIDSYRDSDVNSMVDYFNTNLFVGIYAGGPASKGGGTCI